MLSNHEDYLLSVYENGSNRIGLVCRINIVWGSMTFPLLVELLFPCSDRGDVSAAVCPHASC